MMTIVRLLNEQPEQRLPLLFFGGIAFPRDFTELGSSQSGY